VTQSAISLVVSEKLHNLLAPPKEPKPSKPEKIQVCSARVRFLLQEARTLRKSLGVTGSQAAKLMGAKSSRALVRQELGSVVACSEAWARTYLSKLQAVEALMVEVWGGHAPEEA
jgi:hypothetical protein